MTDQTIYIPFPRELYDDIIRFSDGKIRPELLAESQVNDWVAYSVEYNLVEVWGDRAGDVAKKYAPHFYNKWMKEQGLEIENSKLDKLPLVWKEVSIAAGSDVRMAYSGRHYYAVVKGGKIVDKDGEFTPSEWASKVAGGTSRNAWRDLWFKEPFSSEWKPAQLLREKAIGGEKV